MYKDILLTDILQSARNHWMYDHHQPILELDLD